MLTQTNIEINTLKPQAAIIGMDAVFGAYDGLASVEQAIYKGFQHFTPSSVHNGVLSASLNGSYNDLPPDAESRVVWMIDRVVNRALEDAGLSTNNTADIALFVIGSPAIQIQDISAAKHFQAVFDHSQASNPWMEVLHQATNLLAAAQFSFIVIAAGFIPTNSALVENIKQTPGTEAGFGLSDRVHGWSLGESAGALVLANQQSAEIKGRRVYAILQSAAASYPTNKDNNLFTPGAFATADISATANAALDAAEIRPDQVGYIDVFASGHDALDGKELTGLKQAYPATNGEDLHYALGSAKSITGHIGAAVELCSTIKVALCLYNRFFPANPHWSAPKLPGLWKKTAFFVPVESYPWFRPPGTLTRAAGINTLNPIGGSTHTILTEQQGQNKRDNAALRQEEFFLFPIGADHPQTLIEEGLTGLTDLLDTTDNLRQAVFSQLETFSSQEHLFTACLLGSSREELLKEIEFARSGIPKAIEKESDWQTPSGSCFSPAPLGGDGGVAFVYPGAFNSYVGIGKDLFYYFPNALSRFAELVNDPGRIIRERRIYPRSLYAINPEEREQHEAKLQADPIAMLTSGTSLAILYTYILRDFFGIKPSAAFGYSLGENSMMFASDVWGNADQVNKALEESPLFHVRLSGPHNAVRQYWNLEQMTTGQSDEDFWASYVVMAKPDRVREAIENNNKVFLTHINTPRQVVIAGDQKACLEVIGSLKTMYLKAPFNYALHCPAMQSEHNDLSELHSWEVKSVPAVQLYSTADYSPVQIERHNIADKIATTLTTCVDFPRIIDRVYNDNIRIFIEVGAGSNCSKWVEESLRGRPHLSAAVNRQSTTDHNSILRLLARLTSHRTPLDLSPLYT
jgi:PfaB family protein